MARKNTKKPMRQPEAIEPDLFADEFFSERPAAITPEPAWDEPEDRPKLAADKRRAMVATITIFSVLAVAVGGFTIYTKLIMPTPVTLGASSATFTLPQAPVAYEATPIVAPVLPAPVVAAAAPADVGALLAAPNNDQNQDAVGNAAIVGGASPAPTSTEPVVEPTPSQPAIAHAHPRRSVGAQPAAPRVAKTTVDPMSLSAQAMRELNAGHAADARRLAQQAVQAHPEQADGWIVLGAAHDALGNHDDAKNAYASCTARAFGTRVATCRALAR